MEPLTLEELQAIELMDSDVMLIEQLWRAREIARTVLVEPSEAAILALLARVIDADEADSRDDDASQARPIASRCH